MERGYLEGPTRRRLVAGPWWVTHSVRKLHVTSETVFKAWIADLRFNDFPDALLIRPVPQNQGFSGVLRLARRRKPSSSYALGSPVHDGAYLYNNFSLTSFEPI